MNKTKITQKICTAIAGIMIASSAQAQGHVSGGDPTASDFQYYVNRIDAYLLTEEGKTLFPEIKQPEFHQMAQAIKPVVKNERVYDSFGVAQTCVSHSDSSGGYFQCDLSRLPKIDLNSQPTFYRLAFHELLFQVNQELPISVDIPSSFSISSRLQLRLETFQAWIPGATEVVKKDCRLTKENKKLYSLDNEWINNFSLFDAQDNLIDHKSLHFKSVGPVVNGRRVDKFYDKCDLLKLKMLRSAKVAGCSQVIQYKVRSLFCASGFSAPNYTDHVLADFDL